MTPHLPIIADNFRAKVRYYRRLASTGEARVILTRHGRAECALVSTVDLARWEERDAADAARALRAERRAARRGSK